MNLVLTQQQPLYKPSNQGPKVAKPKQGSSQSNPTKYQRENCVKITDISVKALQSQIIDATTSTKSGRVKLEMPMPYFPSEKCLCYLDITTGHSFIFHEDGSLWGYKHWDEAGILKVLTKANSIKYAKNYSNNVTIMNYK